MSGTIERIREDTTTPLPNAWVVLHRVGRGSAGPLDSIRSDARGRYQFDYRTSGDSAVYFASSMYGGVAYFTPPFTTKSVSGDSAEIAVFDTSSTAARVSTRSHHVIVFVPEDDKTRRVSEVYWLENTTALTKVASHNGPSWTATLPPGAANGRIDDGSVPADGVHIGKSDVQVFAPLSPGLHQINISYDLPAKTFPLKMSVRDSTMVLEVLVEDIGGVAKGAGLATQKSVTAEQRTFQRYLAHDVAPGSSFQVSAARKSAVSGRTLYVLAVVTIAGVGLLFGLARGNKRGPMRIVNPMVPQTPMEAEGIAHAIASLDEQFAKRKNPTDDERAAYTAKRDELKAQLTAVLEARDDRL